MKAFAELSNLSGRTALVTGGAGTIGQAFCEVLIELGAFVIVADIDAERLATRVRDLERTYGSCASGLVVDVSSEAGVERALGSLWAARGETLDILVNNAAYPRVPLPRDGFGLADQGLEAWDANLAVILRGTFLMTRGCTAALAASGRGTVTNIASIYGLVGPTCSLYEGTTMGNEAYYAAGKGGVVQLTRYLASMLAPRVRVNCIAPGGLRADQPATFQQRYCDRTPLGRMATAEDLKGALAYFVSDLSAYTTGQVLAVDGGWTAC